MRGKLIQTVFLKPRPNDRKISMTIITTTTTIIIIIIIIKLY